MFFFMCSYVHMFPSQECTANKLSLHFPSFFFCCFCRTHQIVQSALVNHGEPATKLFNITADPCERSNVAADNPEVVGRIMAKIAVIKDNRPTKPDCRLQFHVDEVLAVAMAVAEAWAGQWGYDCLEVWGDRRRLFVA